MVFKGECESLWRKKKMIVVVVMVYYGFEWFVNGLGFDALRVQTFPEVLYCCSC